MEKRSGPSTEPWGTLVARSCDIETPPLQDTLNDLSERQDSNHRSAVPEMPIFLRVDRRIRWLTVSKAADSSSNIRTEDFEAALASLRASVTENSAVSVEWPHLKPDCLLSRRLFYARNEESWLNTTRSSGFEMNGGRWMDYRSVVF